MNVSAAAVEVPTPAARRWVEQSLARGHEVSAAVLASTPLGSGAVRAILPVGANSRGIESFEWGGVMAQDEAREGLARVLDELAGEGGAYVIVENDLGRRTDPAVERMAFPLAFVGERIVSWVDLEQAGGAAAAEAIRRGSSGYPRNAFVITQAASDLGLADRRKLSEDFAAEVARALLAVVVGAFDDESYVIWANAAAS